MGKSDSNGYHDAGGHSKGRLSHRQKLPSVEQALPCSPFSSIVPFNVDVVPMPDARTPGFPSLFTSSTEQQNAQEQLHRLNEDLAKSPHSTGIGDRAKKDLRRIIDPESITD